MWKIARTVSYVSDLAPPAPAQSFFIDSKVSSERIFAWMRLYF